MSIMGIDKAKRGYHQLIVWQKLKELLSITYNLTDKLPSSEEFVIKPQMRRAVISVLSNFVEGYLKSSLKEKARFMEIAITSLLELEAQAEICNVLGYWTDSDYQKFDEKRARAGYFLFRYSSKLKHPSYS